MMVITQVLVATKTICDTGRASLGILPNLTTNIYQSKRPPILRHLVCALKGGSSKLTTNFVASYSAIEREKTATMLWQIRFWDSSSGLIPAS
jgi:hypothetical protein